LTNRTEALADYIAGAEFTDFPEAVVRKAKRCILDHIGCTLGGFATDSGRNVAGLMEALGGREDATILGTRTKVALPNAALANTYMANILDYDDTYHGHPGCTVCPTALGGGEMVNASGEDVLTATIVGYEVSSRIAASLRYKRVTSDKVRGITTQTFGAVSSAAKILSLEPEQVRDALGIAGATAPVQSNAKTSGEENTAPTMKIGFYACSMIGAISALLARNNITGPHNILDGETGFWRMACADGCDFEGMTRGLGEEYEIMNVAFKPYSCCRWLHSSLDAALDLVKEHGIDVWKIASVDVKTVATKSKVGYLANPRPCNIVEAVFSLPYSMAVALSGIEPGPAWVSNNTMKDERILELASKVHCVFEEKSEAENERNPHRWPASIKIRFGEAVYSNEVEFPTGSPANMISEAELDAKFLRLARHVLDEGTASEVKRLVDRLERLDGLAELLSLLNSARKNREN
jgi:2-methylcitrate dehydratase PrpD